MSSQLPDSLDKDALIAALLTQNAALAAQIAALEARICAFEKENAALREKLNLPPKTPDNSSTPPSQGRKASGNSGAKPKAKPHPGANRELHPNPTAARDALASACQHCGVDVSHVSQSPQDSYDHIDIPPIKPVVTRVTLHGGVCPCCAKRFKAAAPAGLEPGSPFGPSLRALVIYLRFTQNIALSLKRP